MEYRPMLFNTEMTREILNGNKTQTRRLVKPHLFKYEAGWRVCINKATGLAYGIETFDEDERSVGMLPPPCRRDDVIWVRETWTKDAGRYLYRADYSGNERFYMNGIEIKMAWRPSIHMPKDAARLFLRVENVSIERLQDMSPEDCAKDGGFEPTAIELFGVAGLFGVLWDSTIKSTDQKKYGWNANPWVWKYEFERIPKPNGW